MGKTAKDFHKELQSDSDYNKMLRQKQLELEEFEKQAMEIEKPILKELTAQGLELNSIDDLVKIKEPLKDEIVEILLKWLMKIDNEYNIQEMIIRGFTGQSLNFNGMTIAKLYDNKKDDEGLRWAIANCIAESHIKGLSNWIKERISEKGNDMLLLAASRYLEPNNVIPILLKNFDRKRDVIYKALGEIGGKKELVFLQMKVNEYRGHEKKQIEKAIKMIKKRLKI